MTAGPGAGRDGGPVAAAGDRPVVLVLRALGLGDLLTAVPALRGVRRAWPGHHVVLACPRPLGDLLRRRGLVDEVLDVTGVRTLPRALPPLVRPDGSLRPVDVAVNLHGRGPQSHRLVAGTGAPRVVAFHQPAAGHHDGPAWRDDEHEVDRWCRLLEWAGGPCGREDLRLPVDPAPVTHRGAVVVHPGAAAGSRRWPVERWEQVVRALVDAGHPVVCTGSGAQEAAACAALTAAGASDLCDRLDLEGLLGVVGSAALVLCGDTGVAHVATATGTPSVVLFGPVSPALWGPAVDPHRHTVLWGGDTDAGSLDGGLDGLDAGLDAGPDDGLEDRRGPGDPHADAVDARLAAVTVDQVLAAAEHHLPRPAIT
ncbi:glycosyltransferase family 9 protein [Thalassiella azotivora]